MLPALTASGSSLADVLESCLAALDGKPNQLGLPPVTSSVVVLVDGLGAEALKALSGHARTLAAAMTGRSVIESGFPTTTAAALATLTTGSRPGQHGLVGYSVLDPAHDRIVNQLSGWDDRLDPGTWQRSRTVFETAASRGVDPVVIGPARYRDSGLTRAILRGARYVPAASIGDRIQAARAQRDGNDGHQLVYLYIPELDQAAHTHGWRSAQFTSVLELIDAAVRDLASDLGAAEGLLVTADHGIVDVPTESHILVGDELFQGVRFVAGEPRCLQLHFEPTATVTDRAAIVDRWQRAESSRAWVVTRDEAITAGWFGPVSDPVRPRIGDLLIAARKLVAYYDGRVDNQSGRSMMAQHGSWSPAEVRVPLLRFGAFSR